MHCTLKHDTGNMHLCKSSCPRQLQGNYKMVEQHNLRLSAFSTILIIAQVWIILNFCTGCEEQLLLLLARKARGCWELAAHAETNTLTKHFSKIPQHSATIQGYHGNQIGWGQLESDSEALTWQVRGADGGASSTELYVESHKALSHPMRWANLSVRSQAEEQRAQTKYIYRSFDSLMLFSKFTVMCRAASKSQVKSLNSKSKSSHKPFH